MRKDISSVWNLKESRSSYSHQTKEILSKNHSKEMRNSPYTNKGNNPARRYNNSKYICISVHPSS
jgi:hypothetical protein